MLQGKKIVLGITGSIAAYKACLIIRLLIKAGAEVQVVITPAGKEFITPITLSALTSKPVISDFFSQRDGTWHSHVALGLWADAMLIAPATASTIGKMANGIADNMLITTYLSMKAPVFIAPAMDLDMYAHPSTQHNLDILRSYGNYIIEPGTGFLASHLEGKGRMEEPEQIVTELDRYFDAQAHSEVPETPFSQPQNPVLDTVKPGSSKGTILITAGPTYEKIDPVRFIGNYSSGKMGLALAGECARRGYHVELVCGPVAGDLSLLSPLVHVTHVECAQEMYEAAVALYPEAKAGILCAAVADFTPEHTADQKIKRKGDDMVLRLVPTRDIAAALGKMKSEHQTLAGFALETNDEQVNAENKLVRKNFDFIVLNSLNDKGAGFRTDTNKITIIRRNLRFTAFPLKPKTEVARDIVDVLEETMTEKETQKNKKQEPQKPSDNPQA